MQIRTLQFHEVKLHRSLRLRALRDAPDSFGETLAEAELRPLEYWQEQTRTVTESGSHIMFLACQHNTVQGSTYGLTDHDCLRIGRIGGMWVDSRWRRQGIGRALLEAVLAWANGRNFTTLGLWAPAHCPAAVSLYRKLGFRETGNQRSLPYNPALNILEMECDWKR
ncbi:GNAT family N-acetyltransferase [Oscillatoria sp. CS-180]|uniref:GNAT family N-acetyltransferase n=1 Tax=Oscillatoria sp. CS-180 TaxID=3021720 RepID=UPI00232F70E8|nr:GNAT family N-acetyltransferase [Oscillatoria sp. CS-180]MDB9526322.1 GNAT family N-acetyltransferase [Oscillatoria sp. CS-180]